MRILISGGGIAGLSLGFWLNKIGIEPVVIDHATEFKPRGHFIALKGNGVEVIREMGLESACRAHEIKFSHSIFLNSKGKFLRAGSRKEFDSNLGGYIMLRRSDLHSAIYEAVANKLDLLYETEIKFIKESEEKVEVTLSSGKTASFDLVIGADGIHSQTRKLVFGEGFEVPLGGWYLGLTEKYAHGLDPHYLYTYFGKGQMVSLMPTSSDTVSAIVYFGSGSLEPRAKDNDSIKAFLLEAYRDFPEPVRNLFSTINSQSYVFMDSISQVQMPSIVKGRVALVGDAAHCPTFMSGMGSSLALQGAQLLAMHLKKHATNPHHALSAYEAEVTPIANRYRDSALEIRPMLLDRRSWVNTARNFMLRVTPHWVFDRKIRKFYQSENLGNRSISI